MGIFKRLKRGFSNFSADKRNVYIANSKYPKSILSSSEQPILESIYTTVANEFSKLDLFCYREQEKNGEIIYDSLKNDGLNEILQLRPNEQLSATSFKYITAYQLVKYGMSLTVIHRNDRGEVVGLEPLDIETLEFGQGYETDLGYLVLKARKKDTGEVMLINYADCIHLRLNSNDVFNAEGASLIDDMPILKVIDMQLNTMLNEMIDNGNIKGTLKVSTGQINGLNSMLLSEEDKRAKQDTISERLSAAQKSGVMVLDDGEEWHSFDNSYKKLDSNQMDNLLKYLYTFKGINEKVINGTASYEEMEVFFNKTITPIISQLMDEMNYKLLSKSARSQGKKIDYRRNPFEYIPVDKAADTAYKTAMFATKNEMRKWLFKLGPLEGGDTLLENLNFKGGEQESEQDSTIN